MLLIKQTLLIAILSLCCGVTSGQTATNEEAVEDPIYRAFLNCTVLISTKVTPKEYKQGTGFLVERRIANPRINVYSTKKYNLAKIFLVTVKHVLPREGEKQSITIRVNTQFDNRPEVREIRVPIIGDNGRYLPSVRVNDKNFDVVAVDITREVTGNNIEGVWLPYDIFITKDKLIAAGVTVGDEVFLLGYPAAIFDPRNVWPILRKGIISTVPSEGYAFNDGLKKRFGLPDQIDGFLVDANVFPGSSGGPVASSILCKRSSLFLVGCFFS